MLSYSFEFNIEICKILTSQSSSIEDLLSKDLSSSEISCWPKVEFFCSFFYFSPLGLLSLQFHSNYFRFLDVFERCMHVASSYVLYVKQAEPPWNILSVYESSEPYDLVRTARMGGYGLIVLGPALLFWFNFVSKILPQKDLITTFKKMAMEQTIFDPAMTVLFFSLNAFLQGWIKLLPTMLNGVMYWPVCDFITFRFFPVHLQPLVSNSFSCIWTIYMTYMASLEKVGATS
ncbi:hypothetical protein K2173_019881 [Erythroxylum novogranatense]|uniref:Uncharacterized protein n=1 Tax=Erythroxylum novogranatense TaxID=1862640 RepID=A0AAV8SMI2_9ROSI|nr:hypothetical protein K2173_019881 [Erythroxylum novogranatense]